MNSVMDDNKVLTLPNGERIRLAGHCALVVEVADLQHASPATISRCGMVYVDPKNLGYRPFWKRWVNAREKESEREVLEALFEKYVPACIDRILDGVDGEGAMLDSSRRSTSVPAIIKLGWSPSQFLTQLSRLATAATSSS